MKKNIDIRTKIASAQNRRDELPNLELAKEICETEDKKTIEALIENLFQKDKAIQNDCIKVLYEIGGEKPELIAPHFETFLELLNHKNNRMQWGAMTALHGIVQLKPKATFENLGRIIGAAEKGSVITRDQAMNIIISLGKIPQYKIEAFVLFKEQLLKSATNQLPMYAERALPIIDATNGKAFIAVLNQRLPELEKETKKKRLQKVIAKIASLDAAKG
ncbi:hypothetical protein [Spongiimicrobium salis]|uniref:hypothetical protein n=1 Tax=Spongiimicrobium salis TaxID=1667022 RepID=UPI00374D1A7A